MNPAFSRVLMLVMRFTLEILYCIHTKDFLDSTANLCLGIVTEEGIGGTMKSDEIFLGACHFMGSDF
jgi:hypothetical protein